MSNISPKQTRLAAARTPVGPGFVVLAPPVDSDLALADVLLLRDASGAIVPGRFIGAVSGEAGDQELHEVVGIYRIHPGGEPLESLLGGVKHGDSVDGSAHDWGAMGLPNGLATRVRPIEDDTAGDDVSVAHKSAGYRAYQSNPALSIGPGDTVSIQGTPARVVAVDRRKRVAEVGVQGEVREVPFDSIDELESI